MTENDYPGLPLDEAHDPQGVVRPDYAPVLTALAALGADELARRGQELARSRERDGVVFRVPTAGGGLHDQAFPMDPVPRLIGADDWRRLQAGLGQRARALNAFLDDVHRPGDAPARIVQAGIMPDRLVRGAPGYRSAAMDLGSVGRPRATVYGADLLVDEDGSWVVLEDNLQVPSGLAYVLANRRSAWAAFPELASAAAAVTGGAGEPSVGDLLAAALRHGAPGDGGLAVLSDGPDNSAWYEHRTLAAEMGVPVIGPGDLVADGDGLAAVLPDGSRYRLSVLYRRLGGNDLLGDEPFAALVRDCCRRGTVVVSNAPGNGVADDKAAYAFVGPMIRFYLDEEPLLRDVGTWVLAAPEQYAAVRGRLGELVVKPVDGSGGNGVTIGPELTAAQVELLEQQVAAAPERWIAQDVIRFSTHPTLVDGSLQPRHVDLRLFVLSGADTVVVPGGLTRVAQGAGGLVVNSSQGGGSKDTWVPAT